MEDRKRNTVDGFFTRFEKGRNKKALILFGFSLVLIIGLFFFFGIPFAAIKQNIGEAFNSIAFGEKIFPDTLWFKMTIYFLLVGLVIVIYVFRRNTLREKSIFEQRIVETELKALRSQMNPHFIFNSLNSIQQFILTQDSETANKYLTKFAYLIRKILDNSKRTAISLNEELEFLKLYLELEKLRFEKKFGYRIDVDEELDAEEVQIPPMIIQPYVENSIKHGINSMEGKGFLSISFQIEGKFLICVVEDNGIGREMSGRQRRGDRFWHSPMGMKTTEDRLDILSQFYGKEMSVKVIDLSRYDGSPAGTRVLIKIPLPDSP